MLPHTHTHTGIDRAGQAHSGRSNEQLLTDKRGKCRQGNAGGSREEQGAAAEEAIAIHFKWVAWVGVARGRGRGRARTARGTMDCWVAR